jgi:sigma-E factor negative regulatory protein RseC
MILETGRIVAIEPQGLWVETIQLSACGSCQAQKGCGQSLLAKFGASASFLWVLLEARDPKNYQIGNEVKIGVPEDVIAKGSLFVYMVPLLFMIAATVFAHQQMASDGVSAFYALGGLLLGAAIVRGHSYRTRFDSRLQPVLVDDFFLQNEQTAEQVIQTCSLE